MPDPRPPVLSIIVPVYNERRTVEEVIRRVTAVPFHVPYEIIIVDDGSTDGTGELLRSSFGDRHAVVTHPTNRGKGAAIRTGLAHACGDVFVIQDADLEYDPGDLPGLLAALRGGRRDVVYGSRVLGRTRKSYASVVFHLGGLLVTWWTNVLYGSHITDEATGYKMFTRRALEAITLERSGFDLEPELTGKLLRAGFPIHEVPIAYHPRTRGEGKKIKFRDGVIALWTLARTRWARPRMTTEARPTQSSVQPIPPSDTAGRSAIIFGAGPTGLSTALRLTERGWRVTIIEKGQELGGHGGTRTIHGYDVDDGPHKLYPQVPCAKPLIDRFVGDDLLHVAKSNTISLRGTAIPFPFGLGDLLRGLGPIAFLGSGVGFVFGKLERLIRGRPRTYSDYVIALYGRYAHRLVFRNFAEKLWGDPDALHVQLAKTRIIAPSITELLVGMLLKFRGKPTLSAESFYYPRKGLRQLWEAMGAAVTSGGGTILRTTTPERVTRAPNAFTVTARSADGHQSAHTADVVVSTIPIRTTLELLDPPAPPPVLDAASRLRASSLLICYVVIHTPRVLPVSWMFFPEPQWHFARISEQKSFSETMIPADRTVLMVEIPLARPAIRAMPRERLIAETLDQLRTVGILRPEHEILETFTGEEASVYPIYDLDYQQHLDAILAYTDGIPGCYLNGRHGLFCYNNMDHSMEMGMLLADHIADGAPMRDWQATRRRFYEYRIVD